MHNPIYGQLILDKHAKSIHGEIIVFQQIMLKQLDIHMENDEPQTFSQINH